MYGTCSVDVKACTLCYVHITGLALIEWELHVQRQVYCHGFECKCVYCLARRSLNRVTELRYVARKDKQLPKVTDYPRNKAVVCFNWSMHT